MNLPNGNKPVTLQTAKPAQPAPAKGSGKVLQDTSQSQSRIAQLEAELAATKAKLEKTSAKLATKRQLRCAVSKKGAISLYGINARFPITLYANQWETVASVMPSILQFAKDNHDKLSQPGDNAEDAE